MNKNQILVNNMLKGDIISIKKGLDSDNISLQINAIIHSTRLKIIDKYIIQKILSLKDSKNYLNICAFTVGEFAAASLHLHGVEEYTGDNDSIKRLVESKFIF